MEPNINGNRRAKVELNDPSKTIFSTADYCKTTIGPGVEEYNVLVKKGLLIFPFSDTSLNISVML